MNFDRWLAGLRDIAQGDDGLPAKAVEAANLLDHAVSPHSVPGDPEKDYPAALINSLSEHKQTRPFARALCAELHGRWSAERMLWLASASAFAADMLAENAITEAAKAGAPRYARSVRLA